MVTRPLNDLGRPEAAEEALGDPRAAEEVDAVESRSRSPPVQRSKAPGPSRRRASHLVASLFAARPPRRVGTYAARQAVRKGRERPFPQAPRKSGVGEGARDVRQVHP